MVAQNQHYVPKFVLRNFLADRPGEQVHVFDKHTDRSFITSINKIMAEKRFNDFAINDEILASFEGIACRAEDQVIPAYREVLKSRRLSSNPEQKAGLAVFLAFQLLRTKAQRDQWYSMEEEAVRIVTASGGRMQDVEGWEDWKPSTEESLKREHLTSIQGNIGDFAKIISMKDFVLMEPASNTSFHIGDNPVVRSNLRDTWPRGNLGLACSGIEIYMPLSADLLLCAWCPSLLNECSESLKTAKKNCTSEALRRVMRGELDAVGMKVTVDELAIRLRPLEELIACAADGRPVSCVSNNMEYFNSLQAQWAYRYVVSRDGNFELARQVIRENPHLRRGHRFKVS